MEWINEEKIMNAVSSDEQIACPPFNQHPDKLKNNIFCGGFEDAFM